MGEVGREEGASRNGVSASREELDDILESSSPFELRERATEQLTKQNINYETQGKQFF